MPTHLYFLRHATAQDRTLPIADAERTLTDKGMRQTRAVARFCQRQGLLPQRLLSSPLRRATETASLLSQHLPDCPHPQVVDWLRLGTPTGQALAALQPLIDQHLDTLWLVGHEPDLSDLISCLLGSTHPIVRVKKASLTCVAVIPADTGTPPASPDAPRTLAQLLWSVPCALMD